MRAIRAGNLYTLRPTGFDLSDERVTYWKDHIVRVVKAPGLGRPAPWPHAFVEARDGHFVGLVLQASLKPLDRDTRLALRRERDRRNRRAAKA